MTSLFEACILSLLQCPSLFALHFFIKGCIYTQLACFAICFLTSITDTLVSDIYCLLYALTLLTQHAFHNLLSDNTSFQNQCMILLIFHFTMLSWILDSIHYFFTNTTMYSKLMIRALLQLTFPTIFVVDKYAYVCYPWIQIVLIHIMPFLQSLTVRLLNYVPSNAPRVINMVIPHLVPPITMIWTVLLTNK